MVNTVISRFSELFLEKIKHSKLLVISHFDTDGITSAAIISKTLGRLEKQFSLRIIKGMDDEAILSIPKEVLVIITDLGSGSLEKLGIMKNEFLIIDHHEISGEVPNNVTIFNPFLEKELDNLCSAELTYLVSSSISDENKDLAYLAVIGMVGDLMENNINKTRNQIIKDANVIVKKGLLIYPSTRPLDKSLEYSSSLFIPGVTGNQRGVYELLKEVGIERIGKIYKSLIDLNEKEMKDLVTAIMLRMNIREKPKEYVGNLYLIKFFNKIEDAREISAMINSCSRLGESNVALTLCMGNPESRKKAERIYVKYRQHIISALKYVDKNKIATDNYVIINGKDKIKDTIIGTIASIISFSHVYKEGTIIIGMAYNENRIKISTRIAGRTQNSHNLRELMNYVTALLGGESGGHKQAAGCTIKREDEQRFLEIIKRKLEFELVKV